jgi:hypothetical protein
MDPFDGPPLTNQPALKHCVNCHGERGVLSLKILPRLLKPNPRLDYQHPRWSVWARPAPIAKAAREDWGLLQGFWRSNPW